MLTDVVAWLSANAADGHSYYLVMSADDTASPIDFQWRNKTVSITLMTDGTERNISLSERGSLFTIGNGVTFTLEDRVVLRGRSDNNSRLANILNGGVLVMNGGEISGNTVSSNGGGGYVASSGTFTMNDGKISGNTANYGGGVYGRLTMNGGEISDNTANEYGGGLFVSGSFTMSGGVISGNSSLFGAGVAAYIDSYSGIPGRFTKTSSGGIVYGLNANVEETLRNIGAGAAVFRGNSVVVKKRDTTIPENGAFDSDSNNGWN
jgi:hypothetical protein